MSDVQQDPDWWIASDGRWYPPVEQAPKPGWWLASDGKWYPPRKAKRSQAIPPVRSAPTERLPPVTTTATLAVGAPMSYEAARQVAARRPVGTKPWGLAVLVILGGALVAVGGFLPWGTATIGVFSVSVDGTYNWGDGWIALGIGVVLVLAGSALWGLGGAFWRVPPIVLAAAGLALGIYEVVHITNVSQEVKNGPDGLTAQLNVAYGLIMVVVGGVAGVVGAVGALVTWNRWGGDGF